MMSKDKAKKELLGFSQAFFWAMVIRTFLYQPFNIPTGSMYPTLMVGDFLFVNKFTYGYSRYSFPFSPNVFSGRKMDSAPKLGDVVVFFNPKDRDLDYIKRLVGLPGDRIQVKEGILHINGQPVKLDRTDDYTWVDDSRVRVVPQYIETLPNGVKHPILKTAEFGKGPLDNTEEFVVPEGHYFMMGDNRDHSKDSRVMEAVGFVPSQHLIGRADLLFFSTEARWWEPWSWLFGARYKRILNVIR